MSDREQEEGGSFRVRDRRQFTTEGERRPDPSADEESGTEAVAGGAQSAPPPAAAPEPAAPAAEAAEPEPARKRSLKDRILGRKGEPSEPADEPAHVGGEDINFGHFILSLTTQALMHLGEVPDPFTNERHHEPALAKQTIDLIAMLQEKTRGNLTKDEERMMAEVLYDLRMRYVKATS